MKKTLWLSMLICLPVGAWASGGAGSEQAVNLTDTVYGYLGIIVFVLAYSLVPLENSIHLRKSKPVLLAAGIIWVLLSVAYCASATPIPPTRPSNTACSNMPNCSFSAGGHDLYQRHGRAQRVPDPAGLPGVAGLVPADGFSG
jgi:hypothetical protein